MRANKLINFSHAPGTSGPNMTHTSTPYFRRFVLSVICALLIFSVLSGAMSTTYAQTRAYVSNANDSTVSVIDTTTNTVIATVPVGAGPFEVAITPDGARVYVANNISDAVFVIDTATGIKFVINSP